VSATSLSGSGRPGAGSTENSTLRVEAVFHDVAAEHADMIAAEMVSRAHELANLPDRECDVDVSVQLAQPESDDARGSGAR
jgi:hypothetical protein